MPDPIDWLIVGLGNPGPEYEHTAHNLGFLVVDRLADRNRIKVSRKDSMALVGQGGFPSRDPVSIPSRDREGAVSSEGAAGSKRVLLAKPQTYMNVSGPSVNGLLVKYEMQPGQLLLVYDDLDLPWQSLRIRPKGSAGGHHGVDSVIRSIGSADFPRVRLGIHGGSRERDGAKIVLSGFKRGQREELDEMLDYAAQAVESIIAEGVEMSMAKFNRRAQGPEEEE
jgi:PTH1 family peptidyl-tRNA hydrolase